MSGRIVLTTMARTVRSSRRVVTVTQSPSFIPYCIGEARMKFRARFWILIDQSSDAPRLRARQILTYHSSSG